VFTRVAITAGTVLALAVGAAVALPVNAAPGGGGCMLQGTAKFSHGPNNTAHAFTYTFAGTLSRCQSNEGSPAAGKIATVVPSKGSGTCANGTTAGVAAVTWADKTLTLIKYTTNAVTAEVVLQGTVIPSYKVGRKVYRTTRFAGASALADLVFQANPTQCAGAGVTDAPISGFAGVGHQS
jgi:hypothetical protein